MAEAPVLEPHKSDQHLICAVCRDVYKSPRFLPRCFHTFCVTCLEGLANIHRKVIPCPICRRRNRVPREGVCSFRVNFYILEEDLERARYQSMKALCEIHHMEELLLYCRTCSQSICTRCRDNDHGTHDITDLGEGGALCREKLKSHCKNLDHTVSWLTSHTALSRTNIDFTQNKAELQESLMQTRHNAFVASMIQQRDKVVYDLEAMATNVNHELNTYSIMLSRQLDSAVKIQQKVKHALEFNSYNDARMVALEKEVSDWRVGLLREANSFIDSTPWLELQGQSDSTLLVQDVATLLYGNPIRMQLKNEMPREIISPLYLCRALDNGWNQIQFLRYLTTEIHVVCGGQAPEYKASTINILRMCEPDGTVEFVGQLALSSSIMENYVYRRKDKCMLVFTENNTVSKVSLETQSQPGPILPNTEFHLEISSIPLAVDIDYSGQIMILMSEVKASPAPEESSSTVPPLGATFAMAAKKREVQMFIYGESIPECIYAPPDEPFFPTDICFSDFGPYPRPLLIADMASDTVHVVSVKGFQFKFLHYLAGGSPLILHPTTLDAFDKYVYIGCQNGFVLRCCFQQTPNSQDENEAGEGNVGVEAEDGEEEEEVEQVSEEQGE